MGCPKLEISSLLYKYNLKSACVQSDLFPVFDNGICEHLFSYRNKFFDSLPRGSKFRTSKDYLQHMILENIFFQSSVWEK
jgi:hypothetical protein